MKLLKDHLKDMCFQTGYTIPKIMVSTIIVSEIANIMYSCAAWVSLDYNS